MAPLAQELARRIRAIAPARIPDEAVAAAKTAILDTVGVTLLGAGEPSTRIALGLPGVADAPGPCLIFGADRRTSALDAALVNGVASHALDFDDFTQAFGGHPSAPILPGLIALSESMGASCMDLMAAYIAGVEAETRIARGVHFHHYDKGWHPTATLGIFGGAAACGHLLDLDEGGLTTALAIAASMASGLKANFGTMTKPLHVGHTARQALFAALLARDGFTANAAALDGRQGYLDVFNGADTYDVDRILADWCEPFEVVDPGISLKQFPCCGSTHPAIAMALRLRARDGFDLRAIERIEILTHPLRLPHTDKPDPRSPLEAKFSIQYCVARALTDGRILLSHFEGDAPFDAAPRALLPKVYAGVHPEMAAQDETAFGAEVTAHFSDGRMLSERVEQMPGRGPAHPMSEQELWAKFSDCAARALPPERVRRLFDMMLALETAPTVRDLTAAIAINGPRAAA